MSHTCLDGFETIEEIADLTSEEILAIDRVLNPCVDIDVTEIDDDTLRQVGTIHERFERERAAREHFARFTDIQVAA